MTKKINRARFHIRPATKPIGQWTVHHPRPISWSNLMYIFLLFFFFWTMNFSVSGSFFFFFFPSALVRPSLFFVTFCQRTYAQCVSVRLVFVRCVLLAFERYVVSSKKIYIYCCCCVSEDSSPTGYVGVAQAVQGINGGGKCRVIVCRPIFGNDGMKRSFRSGFFFHSIFFNCYDSFWSFKSPSFLCVYVYSSLPLLLQRL